jgi:hypothetical protein
MDLRNWLCRHFVHTKPAWGEIPKLRRRDRLKVPATNVCGCKSHSGGREVTDKCKTIDGQVASERRTQASLLAFFCREACVRHLLATCSQIVRHVFATSRTPNWIFIHIISSPQPSYVLSAGVLTAARLGTRSTFVETCVSTFAAQPVRLRKPFLARGHAPLGRPDDSGN